MSVVLAPGVPLTLQFDVLDGDLALLYQSEQDVSLAAPGAAVDVTLTVPGESRTGARDAPDRSEGRIGALRVTPAHAEVPLGARVHLSAQALDEGGLAVAGARPTWRAVDAIGSEVPIFPSGEFVARVPGVHHVIAGAGGQTETATITVREHGQAVATAPAGLAGDVVAEPVEPRWNARAASSAFLPRNRIGRPWLGVRRDELSEALSVGSANYTFSAPVVRLEGRGVDLRLDLTYNSRVWHRTANEVQFDIDGGWPAPGWALGFGKIVRLGDEGSMLVSPDGTRHPYELLQRTGNPRGQFQVAARTTDGSFIDYSHIDDEAGGSQVAQARFPDGTWVDYAAKGRDVYFRGQRIIISSGVVYPTRVTDVNGNVIVIAYLENAGPEIDTITDTLGRTVRFHYDDQRQLTAITGPGLGGSERTLVRLAIVRHPLSPAFSGLEAITYTESPRVVRAIYYPGDRSGYWFGDAGTYSDYGMATRVREDRGMGFDEAPLSQPGVITAGTPTRERAYDYPLRADASLTDVPTYTSMTETWSGADVPPAVTRFAVQPDADPRRTEVTYPNGRREVTFAYNRPAGQFDDGLVYQQDVYDGSRLLQSRTNEWQQGDYRAPRLARIRVAHERDPPITTEFDYGPHNRVTEVRELDFDGASVLRRTRVEYVSDAGYATRHVFSLPSVVEVFEGHDVLAARTEYVYDDEPLRDAFGVLGHANSHNPYAPAVWVPPYDEMECEGERTPPCRTIHHEGFWETEYEPATRFRGNVTRATRCGDPSRRGDPMVERRGYDITGNLVLVETDPFDRLENHYPLSTQFAYPTLRMRGRGLTSEQIITEVEYDFATGLPVRASDANRRLVSTSYDPATLRPLSVVYATGATVSFDYDDQQLTVTETARAADGTLLGQRSTLRNGLGLASSVLSGAGTADPDGPPLAEITRNRYDALGQLWMTQTGPYGETTPTALLWTEFSRDVLGRLTHVRGADGSDTYAHYDEPRRPDGASPTAAGQTVRMVDAWQRERWIRRDALDQVREVVEPDPDGDGSVLSPGTAATSYAYNALGQVIQVVHGRPPGQLRAFRYDGLGRLTHQYLPERARTLTDTGTYEEVGAQWSDVFAYADPTRLAWRMDARGVRTVLDYGTDSLGRLRRLSSTSNPENSVPLAPAIDFQYVTTGDLGRLERVVTAEATEAFAYDDDGRTASKTLVLADQPDAPLAVDYEYDPLNRVRSITYPARYGTEGEPRRRVELGYDLAGRPDRLTVDGVARAADAVYAPTGGLTALTVGPQDPIPISESYEIDPANGLVVGQQIQREDQTLLSLAYKYERDGVPGITGQLVRAVDRLDTRGTTSYEYDAAGRLRQARGGDADPPRWTETYTYDGYGNRTAVAASGTALDGSPMPLDGMADVMYDGATNRISSPGFFYDEAGNLGRAVLTGGEGQRYVHDSLGRLVGVLHDGGDARETHTYGTSRQRIATRDADGGETVFVWHEDSVVAEYVRGDGTPLRASREFVDFGPRLLCTYTSSDARGTARNLLRNPSFEDSPLAPTDLTGPGGGDSAAPGWTVWNNSQAHTTTHVLPTTRPSPRNRMLHVLTTGPSNGLVQTFSPELEAVHTGIWVFVEWGRVGMGTGDRGSTSPTDAQTTTTGEWEHLQAPNGGSPANELIVYAISEEGASFYVDDASVVDADADGTPMIRYHHPDRLGTRLLTTPQPGLPNVPRAEDVELATLPYGTAVENGRVPPGTPRFTTFARSAATGLDYAVNRYYDPRLGRFLQCDPMPPRAVRSQQSQDVNAYAYGRADPVNTLDPTGLLDIPWLRRWRDAGGGGWQTTFDAGPGPGGQRSQTYIEGQGWTEDIVVVGHQDALPAPIERSPEAASGVAVGGRAQTGERIARVHAAIGGPGLARIIFLLLHLWTHQPPPPPPPKVVAEVEAGGAGPGGGPLIIIIFFDPGQQLGRRLGILPQSEFDVRSGMDQYY